MAANRKIEDGTIHNPVRTERGTTVGDRPPRPIQGEVDLDTLVTGAMKQFPKTRARLSK